MTYCVQAVVVGAGVVGLAVARTLARRGLEVIVVEAEPTFGTHASSRNSEVIHAGIYYPPGSLKARLCLEGKSRLYTWCSERGVETRRLGKLIVASVPGEIEVLQHLQSNARACGLVDLQMLDRAAVHAMESQLEAIAALFSPSTGIVDSHSLMLSLLADAEAHGAVVAWSTRLTSARVVDGGFEIEAGDARLRCDTLVNAAGLGAQGVARSIAGLAAARVPRRHLAKGTYAALRGPSPFHHLVYPVPASASLGVHLTLDLAGRARFGPDQQWVDDVDYELAPSRVDDFYPAVRRYWPGLPDGALAPDYTGIRSKVQAPGEPMADFVLQGPAEHGIDGLLNMFGIESPGLTASLALADEVTRRLGVSIPQESS